MGGFRVGGVGFEVGDGLASVLRDARAARLSRAAASNACEPVDANSKDRVGRRRSLATLERLLADASCEPVDLDAFVTRCATLIQMCSTGIAVMMTSVARVEVDRPVAAALVAILGELAFAAEASVPERRVRLYLAIAWEHGTLTVALACPEVAAAPVPGASAADAMRRATRMAMLLGGDVVRGVKDGLMLVGVSFDWATRAVAAHLQGKR